MLGPFKTTIKGVVNLAWPMILISIVIIVSFRLCYLLKNKEKIIVHKELLALSFIIYILCLFQVVTFQDGVSWASNNFIPFKEILRYDITSRLFLKNVIGNMILFLPFGFFVSHYLKVDKLKIPFFLTLIASISIETVQMSIGRVFDVDDIILNLLGGMLGFLIYKIFHSLLEKLPEFCRKDWFLNIISVLVLIGLIVILV